MSSLESTHIKTKVCGIRTLADADILNRHLPDYAGFVFAEASKRRVSPEAAAEIRARLDAGIRTVGVFVNQPLPYLARLWKEKTIDLAQLHGDETPDYALRLKEETGMPLVKVFRVGAGMALPDLSAYKDACDYFLFDTYAAGSYGGTGGVFPWEILKDWAGNECAPPQAAGSKPNSTGKPFFLAGGLTVENAAVAVHCEPAPYGLDISSGVEEDGRKSERLIAAWLRAVRENDLI